ncbi:MAG TPA: hypothetical protein HPP97_06890 [Desulfuromonadales bacterium]|nr:hypothetical protein [Desulfuromonadales bacterium]
MTVLARQANFMLPDDLLNDLKQFVGQRQQSRFVAEALRKELQREKLKIALKTSFGAWKSEDHPELQSGTDHYIRNQRKSSRSERST